MTDAKPNTITIELDLGHLFYGGELRGDQEIHTPLAQGVMKEIATTYMAHHMANLRSDIDREIAGIIKGKAHEIIGGAIEKSIQPTDLYGHPTGEPRSLESLIVEKAVGYLKSKDGYGRDGVTPVQAFIREEVQRVFKSELSAAMAEAKAKVLAAVKEEGAKVLSQTIANMAGIR